MKRYFVSGILAALCLAGSGYIVLESAGYYRKLYVLAGLSGVMGWYTAILAELFQLSLIMLLPTGKENRVRKLFLVIIIGLIYVMTIFAAGMNMGKPLIEKWSQSNRQEKLLGVLLKEQDTLDQQVRLFDTQNQKRNTAISAQRQRDSFQEIKKHISSTDSINEILIEVELVALWLLRVLIQLANLICGRFVVLNWKESLKRLQTKPIEEPTQIQNKIVREWKARYVRQDKGFVGIKELEDGEFIAESPNGKRKYKTYRGALNFFNGSGYKEKIPNEPTNTRYS